MSKGYELGEDFDTIRSKVTMLKDTLENEGEMLVDGVWEEEMLEFKRNTVLFLVLTPIREMMLRSFWRKPGLN